MIGRYTRCLKLLSVVGTTGFGCGGIISPDVIPASGGIGGEDHLPSIGGSFASSVAAQGGTSSIIGSTFIATGGAAMLTATLFTTVTGGSSQTAMSTPALNGGSKPTGGTTATGGLLPTGGMTATGGLLPTGGTTAAANGGSSIRAAAGTSALPGPGDCTGDAPCGGTLDGAWEIVSNCVQGDLVKAFNGTVVASGMPEECSTMFSSYDVKLSGILQFANGTEIDRVESTSTVTMIYDAACLSALIGQSITPTTRICRELQSNLADGMTCSLWPTGSCVCSGTLVQQTSASPMPYSVSGNRLTYNIVGAEPIDYCVSGTQLTMYQSSGGADPATLVITLEKL